MHPTQAAVIFGNISTALGTELDVWGRVAETGSGNKWPLVAFKSARLEQLGGMLTFCKGLIFLFYGTASLSH